MHVPNVHLKTSGYNLTSQQVLLQEISPPGDNCPGVLSEKFVKDVWTRRYEYFDVQINQKRDQQSAAQSTGAQSSAPAAR